MSYENGRLRSECQKAIFYFWFFYFSGATPDSFTMKLVIVVKNFANMHLLRERAGKAELKIGKVNMFRMTIFLIGIVPSTAVIIYEPVFEVFKKSK